MRTWKNAQNWWGGGVKVYEEWIEVMGKYIIEGLTDK